MDWVFPKEQLSALSRWWMSRGNRSESFIGLCELHKFTSEPERVWSSEHRRQAFGSVRVVHLFYYDIHYFFHRTSLLANFPSEKPILLSPVSSNNAITEGQTSEISCSHVIHPKSFTLLASIILVVTYPKGELLMWTQSSSSSFGYQALAASLKRSLPRRSNFHRKSRVT